MRLSRRFRTLLLSCCAMMMWLPSVGASPVTLQAPVRLDIKETLLASIADSAVPLSQLDGSVTVSPDGLHFAYQIIDDTHGQIVFRDGKRSDYTSKGKFVFSPDCQHLADVVWHGEKEAVVVDGKEGPLWDEIDYGPVFSADSSKVAYVALLGKRCYLLVNHRQVASYEAIGEPVFSPNSQRLAFLAVEKKNVFFVVDGKRSMTFDTSVPMEAKPVFSPDSQHIAFPGGRSGKCFMVIDGKTGTSYDDIANPVFSPDSTQCAYQAEIHGLQCIVRNGKAGRYYDQVDLTPAFSPDSRHLAYVALRGEKSCLVVDGKEGALYPGIDRITYSPDSNHLAYRMTNAEQQEYLCVDGVAGKPHYGISRPVFSPDSCYVAYYQMPSEHECHLVVNTTEGRETYDGLLSKPLFTLPTTLHFLAVHQRRDKANNELMNDIVRVNVTVSPVEQ